MKRALAILLTVVMLLSMIPTAGLAEGDNSEVIIEQSTQSPEESPNSEAAANFDKGEEEPKETESSVPEDAGDGYAFAGCGSEEEPFEIDSEDSLRLLSALVNEGSGEYAGAYYVLTSDISLTAVWTPIGNDEHPFFGSFDGNGKKLAGLSAGVGEGCFGLFGVTEGARISGVALDDVYIEATGYAVVGAIVGYMQGGSLSESCVTGTVNSDIAKYCGGLVGCAEGAEIVNCFSTVEMTADGYTGGIAGFGCDGATIDHCYNIGFIFSTGKGAFGSVLGNEGENIDLSSCYCIDTTDKGAVFLTREEAADLSSFKGFDFDGVWFVDKSSEYPYPVLKVNPCRCDAKWAPDTTEYPTGYVDNEEHNTPLSKNALLESEAKSVDTYASYYIIPNLPDIRNQNPYGTCWAHAIMAAAETNLIKKGYADSSINLSELQLAWFHHNGTKNSDGKYEDPLNNFGGDRNYSYSTKYGFWGGDNYYAASKSLASWIGLINEDETTAYSQTNAENIVAAGGLDYSYAFSKDAFHLENVKMMPLNSGLAAVKKALLKYGAVCFSYLADDSYMTSARKYYYSYQGTNTDHAVCIVGWDDNISKDLFYDKNSYSGPKNDGAWIVRNSWGSNSGDGGYFYMSYESSYVTAGNKAFFVFDFEPASSYEKCYQYDGTACYTKASGFKASNPSVANVFTASGNDTISAVSFWMEDNADLNYTVKVYTDITGDSDPTSGTLAASVSGQTDYAGYYTVALPEQVSVSSGSKFSVVLQIKNDSGDTIYFPYDAYKYNDDNDFYDAHSEAGQSFYSGSGTKWTDKGENNGGNYRIKAFTADDPADPRPAAPTISVSSEGGSIVLSWKAVSNAADYTVYRAITPDGSYSEVGTTADTSYTDTTAVSGTVYYYKVTASTKSGSTSRYSNTASGLIGSQTSFIISYDANGGSEAPAYQIKTAGTELQLSEEIPRLKNYRFLGWSEDSAAKAAEYEPGGSYTKDADAVLYAVWFDGIMVDSPDKLESSHDYANNTDQRWYFTDSDAVSISLTFDSKTETEKNYDFIYIYDGSKNLIGKYSGTELASQTVTIPGDTVCIRLIADVSSTRYGFKVSSYEIIKNMPYTITFVNDDGTELQSSEWDYGATPTYTGTPTKPSTVEHTYTFTGWSPEIAPVTGEATYTAQFREDARKYTVKFVNEDGTVLQSSSWSYGTTPSYSGKTPTKAESNEYTYTFSGWSPEIAPVTGEASYKAQFSAKLKPVKATSISVSPSSVTMYKGGQKLQLTVTAQPANASNACTWKSSNTLVASVDSNGVVTTKSFTGTATITATASDGSKKTAKCTVKVVKPVTGLTLTTPATTVYPGQEIQLSTSITPSNAPNTIEWSFTASEGLKPYITLSNGKLSVSSNMPGECAGPVTVYAKATGCSNPITKSVTINVAVGITSMTMYADGVPVSSGSGELWVGDKSSMQLSVAILPAQANQSVTWKSSNTAAASVDGSGKVTALAGGSTTITATSADGTKSVSYNINVKEWASSVTVSTSSTTVTKGSSLTPTAAVLPATATNRNVRWEISPASDKISFDSSTGKISVLDSWNGTPSSVTLTAYALGAKTDNVCGSVTVNIASAPASKAKSVTIYTPAGKSASTATVKLSQGTQHFTAKVSPTDASQTVAWSSSNSSVATVDQYGNITPVKRGLCTIKVKTTDGTNKTDSILITVTK